MNDFPVANSRIPIFKPFGRILMKRITDFLILLFLGIMIGYVLPHSSKMPSGVLLIPGPAHWIEVYHNGQLTSEWQPSEGAIY